MNGIEIFLFILLIILVIVGIIITVYFVKKNDSKKVTQKKKPLTNLPTPLVPLETPPTNLQPSPFTNLEIPLTNLINPNNQTPVTKLQSPLTGLVPVEISGNPLILEIYNAISPSDNGAAAYNILNQNEDKLVNLTPFQYGIAVGLGYYLGVYENKDSISITMEALYSQLQVHYSGDNLATALCGMRYTFIKAGYYQQVPDWQSILVCK